MRDIDKYQYSPGTIEKIFDFCTVSANTYLLWSPTLLPARSLTIICKCWPHNRKKLDTNLTSVHELELLAPWNAVYKLFAALSYIYIFFNNHFIKKQCANYFSWWHWLAFNFNLSWYRIWNTRLNFNISYPSIDGSNWWET